MNPRLLDFTLLHGGGERCAYQASDMHGCILYALIILATNARHQKSCTTDWRVLKRGTSKGCCQDLANIRLDECRDLPGAGDREGWQIAFVRSV